MEFKKYKLNEVLTLNPTLKLKKNTIAKKIAMENIKEYQKKIDSYTYSEFKSGSKFMNGDTLLARITPCLENGKTAYVDILDEDEIAFGSTEFFVLRPKDNLMDSHFLYYLMRTNELRNTIIKSMTGTSGRQRAQKESILEYEFCLPSLKIQTAIAKLLKNLDDKIETNKKIIANLEELSQTLFKRWFVDFEFPDENGNPYKSSGGEMVDSELGKIPKGWGIKNIESIAFCQNGYSFYKAGYSNSGYFVVDLGNINSNSQFVYTNKDKYINKEIIDDKKEKFLLKKNDLVMVMTDRTQEMNILGRTVRIQESNKYVLNQRIFRIRVKNKCMLTYLQSLLNSDEIRSQLKMKSLGSAQKYINTKHITEQLFKCPDEKLIMNYHRTCENIFVKSELLNKQIMYLTQLRDTLLPKLMSGEIEIPDDIEVNEDELSI
ncbi:restriction endonuclease subunit S [Mammaliicoccus sciuri]|uniref:restriction endonuclease subunit S n=1 Tax=Mammaliicoccus sciuri TaxID=1296 RepID=UPI000EECB24F|nr:restriction endonuclease subunit S [Mammaliicoccus sciuri]MCJ0925051.1 restriction endonuclease subunit S [Mammaliicoccus sciuri]MDO0950999.1 restriction endonuclease subunit S [Mammaliicoccus sciuri]HCW35042.1 restriction endonuclease subunit S [Staphylococcus sp.]